MFNAKSHGIWLAAVFLLALACCTKSNAQSVKPLTAPTSQAKKQEQKPNSTKPAEKAETPDTAEKPEARRRRQAQFVIENIAQSLNEILNPIVRLKAKMLVGDAYWNFQPDRARELLAECFRQLNALSFEADDFGKFRQLGELNKATYKGRDLDSVKSQLRFELLALIGARDSALARSLLAEEQAKKKTALKKDDEREGLDEMLIAARSVMQTDPTAAARIIGESGQAGLSTSLFIILSQLRARAPAEASTLFNQLFAQVRAGNDLWELEKLLAYLAPSEVERLTGKIVVDPQFVKDRQMLLDYIVAVLAGRVQAGPPGDLTQQQLQREYFLWKNLSQTPAFKEVKPAALPLINTRLGQLDALLPQAVPRTEGEPWSEERLQRALATAKSSTGEKRDQALMSAAFATWRFGAGNLNQAIALLDQIENREVREMNISTIYFQASKKALQNEGAEQALSYANKINWPVQRAPLYVDIIAALRADKKTEQVVELQQALLDWLGTCERNTDTASALLTFFDSLKPGETERGLAALDTLVAILNDVSFDLPTNPVRGRAYWYPEYHDFKKSLAPLVRADFDGGWQRLEKLNNQEARFLLQAAFCGEYLRLAGASQKPVAKP